MKDQEYEQDEWKIALHTELLTAMTGGPSERNCAHAEIGYYYQCYAPATLYKYYPNTDCCLNSVKHNQMWYSAPWNVHFFVLLLYGNYFFIAVCCQ